MLSFSKFVRISTENISAATDQILLVSLFQIISEDDENNVNDGPGPNAISYSPENIHDLFMTRFPPEVISDRETVHVLGLGVSRIENLDITRYKPVKTYAKEILNEYLSNQLPIDPALSASDRLAYRNHHVHSFIASHPNNRSLHNRLINAGYHPVLFDDVQLSLYMTDVPLGNAETSYRTALRDCFQHLVLRMLRLARCDTVTLGDGSSTDVAKLFGAEDSVYELKSKRALAMRAVDQVLRQKEVPELLDAKVGEVTYLRKFSKTSNSYHSLWYYFPIVRTTRSRRWDRGFIRISKIYDVGQTRRAQKSHCPSRNIFFRLSIDVS